MSGAESREITLSWLQPTSRLLRPRPLDYFVHVRSGDAHHALVGRIIEEARADNAAQSQGEVEAVLIRALLGLGYAVRIVPIDSREGPTAPPPPSPPPACPP